jgi:hypothetical protein
MQKQTITIGKHVLDYDGVRHYLVTHSFIGWLIASTLREKHGIPNNLTSQEWLKRLTEEHWDLFTKAVPGQEMSSGLLWLMQDGVEKQVFPEVGELAKILKLDEKLLRIFILYNNVPFKISGPKIVHYASSHNPITEPGTYLRIDERTTIEDVKTEMARLKQWQAIQKEAVNEEGLHTTTKQVVKTRRKQIEKGDELAVQDYLAIEREIITLAQEQKPGKKSQLDMDYGNTLVEPAFERVAGDSFDIESDDTGDEEFDKQLMLKVEQLRNTYYKVSRRFSLPTSKDKNRILRLISS